MARRAPKAFAAALAAAPTAHIRGTSISGALAFAARCSTATALPARAR